MLRCIRKVHLPLIASISSFFFNIFGNYVLIFGHLGFKPMGIAGASIATLITRIIEFGVIVGYFMFIDKDVGYRVKHIFMSTKGLMKQYVSISIPVLISDGLLALGSSAVTMIIGHMGESFIAANAVISVVTRLTNIFAGAISQSSAVIVGNTIGEGRIDDVRRQSDAFFALGFALGILASILVLLSYPVIIKVYDLTEETAALLKILLMAVAIMVVFDAANSIMTKGVLRAGGDTKALMVGDCIFLLLVSVPLGYLAGLVWHLPSFWVYFFLKIEAILKCIWAFFRNRSGKWIKNVSTENTAP
jgi:putative MATE family efflux protein